MTQNEPNGLRKYMKPSDRAKLGNLPTTHANCLNLIGVARPGKTAKDRAKRGGV